MSVKTVTSGTRPFSRRISALVDYWSGLVSGTRNIFGCNFASIGSRIIHVHACMPLHSMLANLFKYRKIPIIIPGAYFWSKGFFAKFFLGGGGGLYNIFGELYMDEYLRFESVFCCPSNCNF